MMRIAFFTQLCLALAATFSIAQPKEPLKVIGTFPKGQTEGMHQARTVIVTFNKPVVPLQQLPEAEGTGPLTIVPTVQGKFRWLGTSTLSFVPHDSFEISTEYRLTIPAGLKASDGSVLEKEVEWSFTTPRPLLLASFPGHNQQWVELNPVVLLRFNQRMNRATAGSFIHIREGSRTGTAVPFSLAVPTNEELSHARVYWPSDTTTMLALHLQRPLEKGKRYVVTVAQNMKGERGSLGMAQEASFAFETYGEFSFRGVDNATNRRPNEALTLHFSNPVALKELAQRLTFSPTVEFPGGFPDYDWSATDLLINLDLKPETKYTCTISKELKDVFGQTLGKDVEFALITRSYDPFFTMTTGHGILESYGERKYPVNVVNLNALSVKMMKLTPSNLVRSLTTQDAIALPFDITKEWQVKPKRNVRTIAGLQLDDALNASKKGAVLLQVSEPTLGTTLRTDVQVTEMGVTAKFSPDDVLVWVTTLKNAMPVADARVELRDDSSKVLWQGTTDADGFAKAPGWGKLGVEPPGEWSRPHVWAIVTKGDDLAYTMSDWQQGIEPYRFNIMYDWSPEFEPWQGSIMTDRGLYRTGEEVQIKGIFRNRSGGEWSIRNAAMYLRIYDSQDQQMFLDSMKLNEFGSLAATFRIPPEGRLGYYRVEALLKESTKQNARPKVVAAETFRVEAYRVSEFEVTARLLGKSYIVGDGVKGALEAKYLFGGAMKGANVRWRLRYEPSGFVPAGWEEFWFGRNAWSYDDAAGPQPKLLYTKDTTLNAKGMVDIEAKTQVGDIRASGTLVLEGDVTSPSRQTLAGRASAALHGGEFYIGIQPASTFIERDSVLSYKVVVVSPDGKPVPGRHCEARILKREWHSVRKASAAGGYEWESEAVDTTLETLRLVSEGAPLVNTYRPKHSGFYVIEVKGTDARGNEIGSDAYFYVSGSDYVAWERTNDDRIELIADKKEYKPGQTARIIVKNPYEEATALVTVEREGILKHWRTLLKGSAPEIRVHLTEQSLPNVFVSVVLLQGRMSKTADLDRQKDVGRPSFKIGYVQLTVDPGTRHLTLTTSSDKQNYRPGDTVTVTLHVKNASGNPVRTEVTMSVADKGVLNLIGYKLPDPFEMFYGPRPLAVSTTESRAQIVQARSFGEKGEDEGGGGGMDLGGVETRGNFKYTAYWNPVLRTDSAGNLSVRFALPDNLTTFKIMAVAQSKKSEFGYAENSFTVSKPLLLQPSVPRFARLGDAFEAGVVVHNYSEARGTVALKTSGKGIHFKGKEVVEFALGPGESKEIRYPFEATAVGKATFTFQAALNNNTDGLTVSIPVHVPRRKETVAQFDAVADSLTSKLIVPANTYEGLGSLEFTASSSALVGLENSVDYLFTYPYGCIEQKASRVLPIILGREMVEAFGFETLKGKDAKAVVASTIREFGNYQTYTGGFAYWPGDQHDSPYASAYVMSVLVQAKRHGYSVNDAILTRGTDYIKNVLRYQDEMPNYPYTYNAWAATKCLILYTLALLKQPEPAYYEMYFKNLDRIPLSARAHLLKAVALSSKNKKMMQAITKNLLNNIKVNPTSAHFEDANARGLEWCWDSNTRTTAIILQTLLETGGFPVDKADLPAKMVKWLLQKKRNGRWENTQENVHVVDALATYFTRFESAEPKFKAAIILAGKTMLSKMFEGRSLAVEKSTRPLDGFEKGKELPLQSKKEGTGMLYAGIRMSYYPKSEATMRDEGIAVLKTMEPLIATEKKHDGRTFVPGTIVKVTLRVITPQQRNFVVVDDPLPAGLEAVNTSLVTESAELGRMLAEMQWNESSYRWWGSFNHHEFRDDRVLLFADELASGVHTFSYLARATTFGTFSLPPTYTEMMYEPEVFGQTAGGTVEVRP